MPNYSDLPVIPVYEGLVSQVLVQPEDAISRFVGRSAELFPPFMRDAPVAKPWYEIAQEAGFYNAAYQQSLRFLRELSGEELVRLTKEFSLAMSELDAERQELVYLVAGKTYAQQIDMQAKRLALGYKLSEQERRKAVAQARYDALEADKLALETVRIKTEQERIRIQFKIQELEVKVEMAALEREQVEVQILEEQLQAENARLQVVEAALDAVNIQVRISAAMLDAAKTQASLSGYEADIARLDAQIADTQLTPIQALVAEAEADALEARVGKVLPYELSILSTRAETILLETRQTEQLGGLETQQTRAEKNVIKQRVDAAKDVARAQEKAAKAGVKDAKGDAKTTEALGELQAEASSAKAGDRIQDINADVMAARVRAAGAVAAASIAAEANVTSTLTHILSEA